jgi:hypothetical protein
MTTFQKAQSNHGRNMTRSTSRRQFLKQLGISSASLPFLLNLSSLSSAAEAAARKRRVVFVFSPNGTIPKNFWPQPNETGIDLPEILTPLEPFKNQVLTLEGLCDKIRGDGDSHMRGMGCLLTGTELFPGNIQGGSHTPAGWATGISIDQEIKNFLNRTPETCTRFGSLEFGVMVPDRADTWTRWIYADANKPIAPIDDPYQMFSKLYGKQKDREAVRSVLDDVTADLSKVRSLVSQEDRQLLEEHTAFVRQLENELTEAASRKLDHPVPELEPGVREDNDNMPAITKMQIDLMVNSFQADFNRIASLQFTNSVGGARMRWLDIEEGHHSLSHEPDSDAAVQAKLTKINKWFCSQVAYLVKKLADTPEPNGEGSLLDNTTVIWTNELGKGNSHTLDNIPFVLIGGGLDYKMGRALKFGKEAHNRLLLSIAHSFGHELKTFGNPDHCGSGSLSLS